MADLTSNQVCNICCIHYNAGLRCCALGSAVEGGRLFYKKGGYAWIVAPATTQVSRTWYARADAVTTAQAAAPCGDWFIPSLHDLVLGNDCKSFWDSFSATTYWVDTDLGAGTPAFARQMNLNSGIDFFQGNKTSITCVRAFRRVLY